MGPQKKQPPNHKSHYDPESVFPRVAVEYAARYDGKHLAIRYFRDWLKGEHVPGAIKIGSKYWIRRKPWDEMVALNNWDWIATASFHENSRVAKLKKARARGSYAKPKRIRKGKQKAPVRFCAFFKVHGMSTLYGPAFHRECRTAEIEPNNQALRFKTTTHRMKSHKRGPVRVLRLYENAYQLFVLDRGKRAYFPPGYNTPEELLSRFYRALNLRDIEGILVLVGDDASWPESSTGDRVLGKNAIRAFFLNTWANVDPSFEVLRIDRRAGRTLINARQVVKNLNGQVLSDTEVWHIYTIVSGLIVRMDLQENVRRSDDASVFSPENTHVQS